MALQTTVLKKLSILTTLFLFLGHQESAQAQTTTQPLLSPAFYLPAETTVIYELCDISIPVKILQYGGRTGLLCINLHDNETTSVNAAKEVLQYSGGTLVKIENRKQRLIRFRFRGQSYAFDPNRMFSREGISQTLLENCGRKRNEVIDEIGKFAAFILSRIPDSVKCIVALHNNTDEAFSVKSYIQAGNREKDARDVKEQPEQDVDDIVLTTDTTLFKVMGELGYNSILQDNENARRDGSLSIWSGENGRRYINIETQHGKLDQYIEMLGKLLEWLQKEETKEP